MSAVFGALATVAVAFVGSWQLTVLVGFVVAAGVHLALVWTSIWGLDVAATRASAQRQDDSRAVSSTILLVAATASLAAVVVGLVKAGQVAGVERGLLTAGTVATVVTGWVTVHSVYLLHYAHLYYYERPEGGIGFPGDEEPDYLDFAYFAFTVGMTYQVSDTEIRDRRIRRMTVQQALLSFLFGTVVIGTTINLMAGALG